MDYCSFWREGYIFILNETDARDFSARLSHLIFFSRLFTLDYSQAKAVEQLFKSQVLKSYTSCITVATRNTMQNRIKCEKLDIKIL